MIFAVVVILACVPLRRIGWAISKSVLYTTPQVISVFIAILWAAIVAYLVHALIRWQSPNLVIKIIFGYGFGSYLSIPNFALFDQSTLPPEEIKRTAFLYVASLTGFAVGSVVLAFVP